MARPDFNSPYLLLAQLKTARRLPLPLLDRHAVDNTRRYTNPLCQRTHGQRRERGLCRCLDHHCAARSESGRHLSGDHGVGEVPAGQTGSIRATHVLPGCDQAANADRLLDNSVTGVGEGRRDSVSVCPAPISEGLNHGQGKGRLTSQPLRQTSSQNRHRTQSRPWPRQTACHSPR
jgi:hypothetical protein